MKISIIVPVYNVENYLRECLDSIFAQSYKGFEVILVNDGSTDSSGTICDEYCNTFDNVKVVHKVNGGLSSARNTGLDLAQGEYILFVDSDDIVSSDMFEVLMNNVDDYDIVSFGIMTFVNGNNWKIKPYMKQYKQREYTASNFLKKILLHKIDNAVCSKLYKKNVLRNIHFKEGKINEDFLFNIDVLRHDEFKIYCLNKFLYYYRIRQGSITQDVHSDRFQFVTNALDMKRMNSALSPFISEYFDIHLFYEIINFSVFIWRRNCVSRFKEECNFCMKYLKDNLYIILSSRNISNKEKIKLLILFIYPRLFSKLKVYR